MWPSLGLKCLGKTAPPGAVVEPDSVECPRLSAIDPTYNVNPTPLRFFYNHLRPFAQSRRGGASVVPSAPVAPSKPMALAPVLAAAAFPAPTPQPSVEYNFYFSVPAAAGVAQSRRLQLRSQRLLRRSGRPPCRWRPQRPQPPQRPRGHTATRTAPVATVVR